MEPIRAESDRVHPIFMTVKGAQALSRRQVPQLERFIHKPGERPAPIWAEATDLTDPIVPLKVRRQTPASLSANGLASLSPFVQLMLSPSRQARLKYVNAFLNLPLSKQTQPSALARPPSSGLSCCICCSFLSRSTSAALAERQYSSPRL